MSGVITDDGSLGAAIARADNLADYEGRPRVGMGIVEQVTGIKRLSADAKAEALRRHREEQTVAALLGRPIPGIRTQADDAALAAAQAKRARKAAKRMVIR